MKIFSFYPENIEHVDFQSLIFNSQSSKDLEYDGSIEMTQSILENLISNLIFTIYQDMHIKAHTFNFAREGGGIFSKKQFFSNIWSCFIRENEHLFSMLRQSWRKRHLINLPPPKMALFWGGVSFLEYFHEFLGLGHKKIFVMTLGQSRCFEIVIGQFRPLSAILWIWEIQKIWNFQYFWANLATFFFKIRFWTKLVLESLNMVFLTFFRSWRWFISIFDSLLSF